MWTVYTPNFVKLGTAYVIKGIILTKSQNHRFFIFNTKEKKLY